MIHNKTYFEIKHVARKYYGDDTWQNFYEEDTWQNKAKQNS